MELDKYFILYTIWLTHTNCSNIEKICRSYDLSYSKDINGVIYVSGKYYNYKMLLNITIIKKKNGYHLLNPIIYPSFLKLTHILGFNNNLLIEPNFTYYLYFNKKYIMEPTNIKKYYNINSYYNCDTQKIAIIEPGTIDINIYQKINSYLQSVNLNMNPNITHVILNKYNTNYDENFYLFTQLIIISIMSINVHIKIFYTENTEYGIYDAINKAIIDNYNIINISSSSYEKQWSDINMTVFDDLFKYAYNKNIIILSATKDNPDFPSTSPYVLACGGTTVICNKNECAWNNQKKAFSSAFFKKPNYQNNITYNIGNMRAIPDIASFADPYVGFKIFNQSDGKYYLIGNTGIVTCFYAGFFALVNKYLGYNINDIHNFLYKNKSVIKDIICGKSGMYMATNGWDPCTGLGVINYDNIIDVYNSKKPYTNFVCSTNNSSTNTPIQFIDKSLYGPKKWLWVFGDGTYSDLQNPLHTYTKDGIYDVSLLTENKWGKSKVIRKKYIKIVTNNKCPEIIFDGNILYGTIPLVVRFNNNSKNDPTYYQWNFGDGTYSNSKCPVHIYTNPGVYNVSLIAKNNIGKTKVIKENYITVINNK